MQMDIYYGRAELPNIARIRQSDDGETDHRERMNVETEITDFPSSCTRPGGKQREVMVSSGSRVKGST